MMNLSIGIILLVSTLCQADVYFHIPRGSNDRLNEVTAIRTNGNRLFDSQNNNRGGYNAGDATHKKATTEEEQYRMKYFYSTANSNGKAFLTMEWTNQHGCGGNEDTDPHKLNCNIVLQYACQDNVKAAAGNRDSFRNGILTTTQVYKPPVNGETKAQFEKRRDDSVSLQLGLHEPFDWYEKCIVRQRNKGLFIADQKVGEKAINTRQNPNGNRNGYECPEERDYYPYWHPTAWKDIAVLGDNETLCKTYIRESFNTRPRGECIEFFDTGKTSRRPASSFNNPSSCAQGGGLWVESVNYLEKAPGQYQASQQICLQGSDKTGGARFIWAVPYDSTAPKMDKKECLVALPSPVCADAPWTRSNHLGNSRTGVASQYTWTLPYFPSASEKRCVLRIRYNISTDDYDPYRTNASYNGKGRSPIENNTLVDVGTGATPLRLAINTAQVGRTFQDRSHVFLLRPRPSELPQNTHMYNLNVRGKRGNIVQTYPAVEYDFAPTRLELRSKDLVHVQWTGSNSHNNGGNGGDGQAGDDGQGTGGTDRSNFVEAPDAGGNFPRVYEASRLWAGSTVLWTSQGGSVAAKSRSVKDHAIAMASAGYYLCEAKKDCAAESLETKAAMDSLLNNAPASFEGMVLKLKTGTYHYMCTRNNNFSNRSQKGRLIVRS